MPEELHQRMRRTFEQLDACAPSHDLPTSAEAWSRLQFRLVYHAHGNSDVAHTTTLFAALYLLAFLIWMTWPGWTSASFIVLLAAAAAGLLRMRVSRSFRN